MFCINHRVCEKAGDNGNCTVKNHIYGVNHTGICGFVTVAPVKAVVAKTRVGQQKSKAIIK